MKKAISSVIIFLTLLSMALGSGAVYSSGSKFPSLASESEVLARVDGSRAYNYDLELEEIAFNHSISDYAFRSSGSIGATEAARWIGKQFETFGLETKLEPFEFASWDLPSPPTLVIYENSNNGTESNSTIITTFQSTHYSWPTPQDGVYRDLVVLPLPANLSRGQVYARPYYDANAWRALNITDKILLVGYEIRWNSIWHQAFWNKLKEQPPAGIIYTYWYSWMSSTPPSFTSVGGLPAGDRGPYYWDLKIPVGWVNYADGLWIQKREKSVNLSANFAIPAVIGTGPHYNVVGKLKGSVNPEKTIMVTGHYDTIMASGFCDNGAGTAGVLELARVFTDAAKEGLYQPAHTLVFVAFAAEELGLVGSINYMKQHAAEMGNVVAVLNLDCIGSDVFHVTETFTDDNGLDLDQLVMKSAGDLGVKAVLEEGGIAGDEYTFRNPKAATDFYETAWRLNAGIASVARVKSSTTLISFPLFFSDEWENGTRAVGWIHTPYDNSTSTTTLNWVEVDDLKVQIQVGALSVVRVSSFGSSTLLSQILIATTVITAALGVVAYFRRSLVSGTLKKIHGSIVDNIALKELVLIIILTALFLFISFISYNRVGRIEVDVQGTPTGVTMLFLGYPFETVGFEQGTRIVTGVGAEGGAPLEVLGSHIVGTMFIWSGLLVDVLLYFLLAFVIVYVGTRLRKRVEATRHPS